MMSRVMIASASEERIRNIIPVFQKGVKSEKIYLICSAPIGVNQVRDGCSGLTG